MFHVKPNLPLLRLTPALLLARQTNRLTVISLSNASVLAVQVEPQPELGGHALSAELTLGPETPRTRRVLATFTTEAEALGQLDRLTRSQDRVRWTGGLAWSLIGALLLFVIWFLFFLPVEIGRLAGPARGDIGEIDRRALPEERTVLARPGHDAWPPPARVDDPAERSVLPAGGDAAGRVGR